MGLEPKTEFSSNDLELQGPIGLEVVKLLIGLAGTVNVVKRQMPPFFSPVGVIVRTTYLKIKTLMVKKQINIINTEKTLE